jgi:hypothetical protein
MQLAQHLIAGTKHKAGSVAIQCTEECWYLLAAPEGFQRFHAILHV